MVRGIGAGLFALGLFFGGAMAGVSDFVGTWTHDSDDSVLKGLFGTPEEDVARVVITPQGASALRIQLFGRCTAACDWGTALAHIRYEGPHSDSIRSLTADFKTPSGNKRLTIRAGAGKVLRFELAADFDDHSGRHDYELVGSLKAQPLAFAAASGAPTAHPVADAGEDCVKINPEDVFLAPGSRGGWVARDYEHVIADFGPDKVAAAKAVQILNFYRFDEQCYIARPKPKMVYWRVAGNFPRDGLKGQDCVDIQPNAITVQGGKVLSKAALVLDYGDDAASAAKAAAVLRTYAVTKQCFVARPNDKMVYWLSQ